MAGGPGNLSVPERVYQYTAARARFGDRVDRLLPFLWRGDPLADEVIRSGAAARWQEALASPRPNGLPDCVYAFVDTLTTVPTWVDWRRIERAGELFYRAGVLAGLVLGLRSLVGGYAAPDGNKPLVFSGRLREQAPRRVAETSRFVTQVCRPGGMRVGGEGWRITAQVRLMHAKVRALLEASPHWRTDAWGTPINQHDMLATNLLFSSVFLDGLRIMGFPVSPREAGDYLHLWRYVGWCIGVDPALLPADVSDALAAEEVIRATQRPPDDDSRALVEALICSPLHAAKTPAARRLAQARVTLISQLSRRLIGDELADQLGLARSPVGLTIPMLRPLVRQSARAGQLLPRAWIRRASEIYWESVISTGLRGEPVSFDLPSRLAHG